MNSRNIYTELENLVRMLEKEDESDVAREIADSLYYGAIATEILMRCKLTLEKAVKKRTLSCDLKNIINNLLTDIDDKLK